MDSRPVTSALISRVVHDLSPYASAESLKLATTSGFSPRDLHPDAHITEVQALALASSIMKKFIDEVPTEEPNKVALSKFLAANEHCARWVKPLSDGSYSSEYELELYGEFKRVLDRAFNSRVSGLDERFPFLDWDAPLDWTKIGFFAENGPHMALGASDCSFLDKFEASTITYSREFLWDLYKWRVSRSDLWSHVEEKRDSSFGHELVPAARLSFVPKTVNESRCICIEPALNIFFQKGVEFILKGILISYFGIDLSKQQDKNRLLCRLGSKDGSFGTIDLSSASDTISLKMVSDCVPKNVLSHLLVLRSPAVKVSGSETVKLDMISTMGNAFTFPLQTIIFASAVEAVYNIRGIPIHRPRCRNVGNYAVNGDDIIVATQAYDDVVKLLRMLGFIVNASKSFNEGFFRESCGSDCYQGTEVRGVYCKTLRTLQDCYSLINRLNRWSARTGIKLPSVISWLKKRCRKVVFVPPHESDSAGIHVPLAASGAKKLALKDLPGRPFYEGHHVYQFYAFFSRGIDPFSCDKYTPDGIYLAAVKGECRGGRLVRRSDEGRFHLRFGSTPGWDSPRWGNFLSKEDFERWIAFMLKVTW